MLSFLVIGFFDLVTLMPIRVIPMHLSISVHIKQAEIALNSASLYRRPNNTVI